MSKNFKQIKCLNNKDVAYIQSEAVKDYDLTKPSYYYSINVNNKDIFQIILKNEITTSEKKKASLDVLKVLYPFIYKKFDEYPENIKMVSNEDLLTNFHSFMDYLYEKMDNIAYTNTGFNCLVGLIYFIENNVIDFPLNVKLICEERKIQFCSKCFNTTINKKDVKLMKCGGCKNKKVFYCSTECQKEDWKEHKKVCEKYI